MRRFVLTAILGALAACSAERGVPGCTAVGPHGPPGPSRACVVYRVPGIAFALHADPAVWTAVGDMVTPGEYVMTHFIDRTEKAQIMVIAGPVAWGSEASDPAAAAASDRKDIASFRPETGEVSAMPAAAGRSGQWFRSSWYANGVDSEFVTAYFRFDAAPDTRFLVRANWPKDDPILKEAATRVVESVRPGHE